MDSELFYGFLNKLFIPQTQNIKGPKLLVLGGHGSHLSIGSIHLCRRSNIHMYCLPPHTTHVFQPLDVVIFHPLKAHFNQIAQNLKFATFGWKEPMNCCKINFTKLFKPPWESMTVTLIKTGFRKCGIFPLDRSAIDTSRISGHSSNPPPPPTSSNPPPPPPPPTSSNPPPPLTSSNPPLPPTSSNPPLPPTSSNPPLPPSSNPNQTSTTSLIGDTSQEVSNATSLIGDTSQEVSNTTSLIGDTSQEVNNACTSTPEHSVSSNLLVLSGIVPASLMESFIFPDINIKGKKPPRVNTKACLITTNEYMQDYNNKFKN